MAQRGAGRQWPCEWGRERIATSIRNPAICRGPVVYLPKRKKRTAPLPGAPPCPSICLLASRSHRLKQDSREGWSTNDATAGQGPVDAALPPPLWSATARGGLTKPQLEFPRCQERNDCPDGRQAAAPNGRSCRRCYPCVYVQFDAWVRLARGRPNLPAADMCRSPPARGPLVRLACRQRTTITVEGRSRRPCAWGLSPFLGPASSCSYLLLVRPDAPGSCRSAHVGLSCSTVRTTLARVSLPMLPPFPIIPTQSTSTPPLPPCPHFLLSRDERSPGLDGSPLPAGVADLGLLAAPLVSPLPSPPPRFSCLWAFRHKRVLVQHADAVGRGDGHDRRAAGDDEAQLPLHP